MYYSWRYVNQHALICATQSTFDCNLVYLEKKKKERKKTFKITFTGDFVVKDSFYHTSTVICFPCIKRVFVSFHAAWNWLSFPVLCNLFSSFCFLLMVHVLFITLITRTRWIPSSLVFTNVASETNRPAPVMPPIKKVSSRAQMSAVSVQCLILTVCLSLFWFELVVILSSPLLHKLQWTWTCQWIGHQLHFLWFS